jgi:hypothetical protein
MVEDPRVQQALQAIARQFPIGVEHLRDVIVRKVPELPEAGEGGQLLYSEASNAMFYFNGTEWKEF